MKLAVEDIREDPTLQLRDGLDMDRVEAMIEFEAEGGQLPPISVVGDDNLLADGHHRLYAAIRSEKLELDANRLPGGAAEAVVVAITKNDVGTNKPLSRPERNKGVKLLLRAGWSQRKIGEATGIAQQTITNIGNLLAARGELPKATKAAGGKDGRPPRQVAVLDPEVAEKLTDTHIVRIAEMVPYDQQQEFAAAVAEAGLSESRTRDAVKELREGASPTEAVAAVTPHRMPAPMTLADIAKAARKRLEPLSEPMIVGGVKRDFWEVLGELAQEKEYIPLEAGSLSRLLAELTVKADHYSSLLAPELTAIAGGAS